MTVFHDCAMMCSVSCFARVVFWHEVQIPSIPNERRQWHTSPPSRFVIPGQPSLDVKFRWFWILTYTVIVFFPECVPNGTRLGHKYIQKSCSISIDLVQSAFLVDSPSSLVRSQFCLIKSSGYQTSGNSHFLSATGAVPTAGHGTWAYPVSVGVSTGHDMPWPAAAEKITSEQM